MTNANATAARFVNGPSNNPRTTGTLRLLMQAQQKLEIGDRIKELRERSPYKQKNMRFRPRELSRDAQRKKAAPKDGPSQGSG